MCLTVCILSVCVSATLIHMPTYVIHCVRGSEVTFALAHFFSISVYSPFSVVYVCEDTYRETHCVYQITENCVSSCVWLGRIVGGGGERVEKRLEKCRVT